jgi:hypothetical protein
VVFDASSLFSAAEPLDNTVTGYQNNNLKDHPLTLTVPGGKRMGQQQSSDSKPGNHIVGGSQFFINIRHNQNNSWQGSIQRLDTGETANFRSALELTHLIESAAGRQSDAGNEQRQFRNWRTPEEVKEPTEKKGTAG